MKTNTELNSLKNEIESMDKTLTELCEKDLKQIFGGLDIHTITKYDIDHGETNPGTDGGDGGGGAGGGNGAAMRK